MKWPFVLIVVLHATSTLAVQAPPDWKQIQDTKEFTGLTLALHQVGVWKSSDDKVIVQVLQIQPVRDAQGVWNFVGGSVSGLTKTDLAPTSSEVVFDTPHISFRLTGKGKQEGGATGLLDTYFVFADSATYMVKVFSTTSTSAFVFVEWDFGAPIRENREQLSNALAQIKDRLDRGVSLAKPSPAPSANKEEEFESAKDATDDELRSELRLWTSMIDTIKEHAINAAKRSGKTPDVDGEVKPFLRRLANNKFFSIHREERIHPGYQRELAQIAALRGEKYGGGSAMYQLGYFGAQYGISLAILIFLIIGWTRRVSRKTAVAAGNSRSAYYARLLLKMSWRVALLVVLSIAVVVVKHLTPGLSERELQSASALTFMFLLLVVPPAFLLSAWSHTKRKFAMQSVLEETHELSRPQDGHGSAASIAVAKALDSIGSIPLARGGARAEPVTNSSNRQRTNDRQRSTWWKRLFTVLEIAVFLASASLVLLLLRELPLFMLAIILLVPVVLAHLLRVAIIYIVEGKRPFRRYE